MTTEVPELKDGSFDAVGPGSRIEGYLIEEKIGADGPAVTFRARHEELGRAAALRVVTPEFAADEEFRARFLRDSPLIAQVESAHLLPVYDAGEAEGLLYVATRYVPDGDLGALVRRSGGTLVPDRAVALAAQLAGALDAAHAAGLVHHDVRPENVLVDAGSDHAYLSGFGLATVTRPAPPAASSSAADLAERFLGTPEYAAPEQVKGEEADGRADQYALACLTFALLTGKRPFQRADALKTMLAHLRDPVPPLTPLRPQLPATLYPVITRAMAKSPADRYDSCADFAEALREALSPAARTVAAKAGAAAPTRMDRVIVETVAEKIILAGAGITAPGTGEPETSEPGTSEPGTSEPGAGAPDTGAPDAAQGDLPGPDMGWLDTSALDVGAPAVAAETAKAPIAARTPIAATVRPDEPDPFAWLARQDHPEQAAPGRPASRPPTGSGWDSASLPRVLTDSWQVAIRENEAYPKADVKEQARDWQKKGHGRKRRVTLLGGTAALVLLLAAGAWYVVNLRASAPHRPAAQSSRPALTLTVPGGGAIDTAWISPDGKYIAGTGQGPAVYVWDTAHPATVRATITLPATQLNGTTYGSVADNLAFSADDSTLTGVVHPDVPGGAAKSGGASVYSVYQWKLATGARTSLGSIRSAGSVAFSGDNSTALTFQGDQVTRVTLTPKLVTRPATALAGGIDAAYPPPAGLSLSGDSMIYHPTADETYVWNFTSQSVTAKFPSSAYTVFSPDGQTILAVNPTDYPVADGPVSEAPPLLWDVNTWTAVTPADPRWDEQLPQARAVYARDTYSTDGSVLETRRDGGKIDLWSTVSHKYLLTITDSNASRDGSVIAGPGGSEVLILATGHAVSGHQEYRQVKVYDTKLHPAKATQQAEPASA